MEFIRLYFLNELLQHLKEKKDVQFLIDGFVQLSETIFKTEKPYAELIDQNNKYCKLFADEYYDKMITMCSIYVNDIMRVLAEKELSGQNWFCLDCRKFFDITKNTVKLFSCPHCKGQHLLLHKELAEAKDRAVKGIMLSEINNTIQKETEKKYVKI